MGKDWHYWGNLGWGPQWDPSIYPRPQDMVTELHAMNFKIMVSVWSKFQNTTSFYKIMHNNSELIPGQLKYYFILFCLEFAQMSNFFFFGGGGEDSFDPYNLNAAAQFYDFVNTSMYAIGVDAIWLDATEPESFFLLLYSSLCVCVCRPPFLFLFSKKKKKKIYMYICMYFQ
ncbi:hypothetical protein RFI_24307 [Reticulomyxa filosa]|uniref:Glycoside hydrolase family 31 TIM barrel domain-containing protein n=1 Tax=Reticulomyxa filosa TaxID=46433 RepID=X6MGB8_RETFI|nr:hypothetical protein RFI_24307 [Reticulomyxa filosa]|eukprot:ETO13068.1 hypothetical protein RFI_24307 [Reticulomyxa filosa]